MSENRCRSHLAIALVSHSSNRMSRCKLPYPDIRDRLIDTVKNRKKRPLTPTNPSAIQVTLPRWQVVLQMPTIYHFTCCSCGEQIVKVTGELTNHNLEQTKTSRRGQTPAVDTPPLLEASFPRPAMKTVYLY